MRALPLLLLATSAHGAGLEVPELGARAVGRAGAFVARADDPTAVFHNPGALHRLRGTQLAFDHNLLWSHARFTRAESSIPSTQNYPDQTPLAPVENSTPLFPLGGFIAATPDLGLEDWTFGLSVFGPSGTGELNFPVKGGQRYMLTHFSAIMVYYGVSAAWGTETFGVGLTAQWADLISMDYSLIADGQPGGDLNPYASGSDVEATMTLSDRFAPTALAGIWWAPTPAWHLGLSGRIIPVKFEAKGDFKLKNVPGQSEFSAEQLSIADSSAVTEMTLPMTARLGARYRHLKGEREVFDIELDVVYEAWSILKEQQLDLEGQIVLFANEPAEDVTIDRRWRDTLSARLGGTWHVLDPRSITLNDYLELATLAAESTTLGVFHGGQRSGRMVLRRGQLWSARCGSQLGDEAAQALASMPGVLAVRPERTIMPMGYNEIAPSPTTPPVSPAAVVMPSHVLARITSQPPPFVTPSPTPPGDRPFKKLPLSTRHYYRPHPATAQSLEDLPILASLARLSECPRHPNGSRTASGSSASETNGATSSTHTVSTTDHPHRGV